MTTDDIVILGLPSAGLQRLTDRFFIEHLDDTDLRHACDNPNEPRDLTSETIAGKLKACLAQDKPRRVLAIYQTPWGFLGHQARKAASAPGSHEHFRSSARSTLGFWRAYHASLLGLHRELGSHSLLINGGRQFGLDTVAALIGERFGLRLRLKQSTSEKEARDAASHHDAIWRRIAEILAPETVDLYVELESCAELMGRSPEFELGGFSHPEAFVVDLLQMMYLQDRIEDVFNRHGIAPDDVGAQLEAVLPLKKENELYLLQLHQVQEELKKYFELNQQKDAQLADLQQRLEAQSAPVVRRIARRLFGPKTGVPGAVATSAPAESLPRKPREGKRVLQEQAEAIKASGLFDETWYLQTYPDVAQDGQEPIKHYLQYGAAEGRNPSAHFDTQWYLETYADVAAAKLNPLLHFVQHGKGEGRQPMRSPAKVRRSAEPVR